MSNEKKLSENSCENCGVSINANCAGRHRLTDGEYSCKDRNKPCLFWKPKEPSHEDCFNTYEECSANRLLRCEKWRTGCPEYIENPLPPAVNCVLSVPKEPSAGEDWERSLCESCGGIYNGYTTCKRNKEYRDGCRLVREIHSAIKNQPSRSCNDDKFLGEDRLMVMGAKDGLGEDILGKWEIVDRATSESLSPQIESSDDLEVALKNIRSLLIRKEREAVDRYDNNIFTVGSERIGETNKDLIDIYDRRRIALALVKSLE